MNTLVLRVFLHDGRYHGEGDWPPSPARLFQALVAGAGLRGAIGDAEKKALEWLEKQEAPLVAAPPAWRSRQGALFYMPNNDSDAIGGDPLQMARIRTATKRFQPYFFDPTVPFVYAWRPAGTASDDDHARTICSLSEHLYQFGRGIDMAWARGEVLGERELEELLDKHPGRLFCPSAGVSATTLPSPCPGSLESLERRYRAFRERFRYERDGGAVKVVFRRPPRTRFRDVPYDSPPSRQLYELRDPSAEAAFAPWPAARVSALVVRLRDTAVEHLNRALPACKADIERALVGRKPDGTNDGPSENRIRIIPLPTVGHVHADGEIRRVLVEVPQTCPLRVDAVYWAFSGLDVIDEETGEILAVLTRADKNAYLQHFGIEDAKGHRVWRTVTPAALPEEARRQRIDPLRMREDAKAGQARRAELERASASVRQALRHTGVRTRVESIRLQREPFNASGARAEQFAEETRFAKGRLWHVEVVFEAPVPGPLILGDGRFLGLGLMAPVRESTREDRRNVIAV